MLADENRIPRPDAGFAQGFFHSQGGQDALEAACRFDRIPRRQISLARSSFTRNPESVWVRWNLTL